jgi:hypothetical protein
LVKKDIFRNLMWYTMPDSNKQYPLSIEGAKKIKELNKQGIKPEELETVEVISGKPKEVEPEFVDVVGQISLRSLEKNSRKRRDRERSQQQNRQQGNQQNRQGGNQQEGNRQGGGNQQRGNRQQGNQQNRQQRPQQGNRNQNQQKPNPNNNKEGNSANKAE